MDSPSKYKSSIAFTDLLFNILVGFVFLFLIAFLLINPIAKKGDIVVPAEFLIVMTWPDTFSDDVDLWVSDKSDHLVGFSRKDSGTMFLDRDDLGLMNDSTVINGEAVIVNINREVVSIRGKSANDYRISVHLYRKATGYESYIKNPGTPPPTKTEIPVTVEVIKINPYRIVYKETKILDTNGQIANFPSFSVTNDGYAVDIIEGTESIVPLSNGSPN